MKRNEKKSAFQCDMNYYYTFMLTLYVGKMSRYVAKEKKNKLCSNHLIFWFSVEDKNQ